MSYGLVFAGGGAKGAYEIGVWDALNRMGIEISAVTGVSIGSVNGAMFAQGDFARAKEIWECIQLSDIVTINAADMNNMFSMKNLISIASEVYKNKGLDIGPLENLLKSIIDEEKIRNSGIDFGLATYSLTDKKIIELFIDQIPSGKLVEYILASACLPGFRQRVIDGKTFIDGGVNNNMPVDMMLKRGYKDIIAVDIGGVGIVKSVIDIGVNIINIKCSDSIIGTMQFETDAIKQCIKRGYYDTYKAFGKLCGDKYYFNTMSYYRAKARMSDKMIHNIESAGEMFGIEKNAAYNFDEFTAGVLANYAAADKRYKKSISENQNFFDTVAKNNFENSIIAAWAVDMIKNNVDYLNNKFTANLSVSALEAASAILYLEKQ